MPAKRAHDRATDMAGAEQHDGEVGPTHDVDEHVEARGAAERGESGACRRRRASLARAPAASASWRRRTQRAGRCGCASPPGGSPAPSPRTGTTIAHSTPSARERPTRVEPLRRAEHRLEQQLDQAAATLAEARAQRKAMQRERPVRMRGDRARSRSPCTRDGRRRSCRRSRPRSRSSACPAGAAPSPSRRRC